MSRRYLSLAVLALMSAGPAWSGDWNSEGIKAYRAGDYQKAEQLYRQTLAESTDNNTLEAAYRNLAVLYQAQGKDAGEFNKMADELAKSRSPRVMSNDPSLSKQEPNFVLQQPESAPSGSSANIQSANDRQRSPEAGSPPIGGVFRMRNTMTESGLGLSTPFGGFQRDSREVLGVPGFGYPTGYGTGYSVQGPNGSATFSDSSPIILNAPNGRPVIIRAPGPNTTVIQKNPDGGTSTIMNRTY